MKIKYTKIQSQSTLEPTKYVQVFNLRSNAKNTSRRKLVNE